MDSLLGDGVQLMAVGMGTVFAFLTLLVGATTLMSRLVALVPQPKSQPATGPNRGVQAAGVQEEEVAAITAAIRLHRERR